MTSRSYASAFERFNNTTVEILVKVDYDDYENTYTLSSRGTVTGDLQPISSMAHDVNLIRAAHGLEVEKQMRFFCPETPEIKEGVYLRAGQKDYEVVSVFAWELGMEVRLKEVELRG